MITLCGNCGYTFDDEYRTTICPHETFAANDGRNNFAHHPGSVLRKPSTEKIDDRAAAIKARETLVETIEVLLFRAYIPDSASKPLLDEVRRLLRVEVVAGHFRLPPVINMVSK